MSRTSRTFAFVALLALSAGPAVADWPTSRGNPQRTGNIDGKPGPQSPKVLWIYESQEHFIAAPSAGAKELFVSGLGAFSTASFHALKLDDSPGNRELWFKRPPFLKRPVVCSPAVVGDKMVLGDGMHQTNDATLYCMMAETGQPLWQYPVPGALVHLEGAPTIADGRVYIGGGAAGVLCVDMNKLTLDGQEVDLPTAQAAIDKKWKELTTQYEADKKKDPDFAIPPSEDALPKPAPKLAWQMGANQLHVDSAVAVVNGRVLAASAKLGAQDNFAGECAVLCLDAATGNVAWRQPLTMNPWAGPTVIGKTVLLGCSSIRFEPKEVPSAKGELTALNLDDGKPLWTKPIAGGVIAPVAAVGDLAIVAATDGKVRAISIASQQEKWTYDADAPFFAGAAVVSGAVYVADLKGSVHALDLATGRRRWKLDLATDPAVKAPGMVFASPIVHGGRLYVATCNHESGPDQQRTVVVCIGEK